MNAYEQTQKLVDTIFSCDLQGKVITIIAPSGMGKTTFTCMQLPTFLYVKSQREGTLSEKDKIVVINTDDSLLSDRLMQVLNEFGVSYTDIRSHISVKQINDLEEQHAFIVSVLPKLIDSKGLNIKYIVVDPFNHLLRKKFAQTKPEYRLNVVGRFSPMLEHQVITLTELARKHNMAVFLTLLPKKQYTDKVPQNWQNAYFGPLEIAHQSDIVLWFSHSQVSGAKISIKVMKHRLKPEGEVYNTNLTQFGLELV